MKKILILLISFLLPLCMEARHKIDADKLLKLSAEQYLYLKENLASSNRFPRTYNKYTHRLVTSDSKWWCSGFYPGTLFYLYQATGISGLWDEGERMLGLLSQEQYNTETHDVGFMMFCSFGNAYKINPAERYKEILVNSARSLSSRFNPIVGCIKSHNGKPEDFSVIIDNMMNLEILFWATEATGDSTFFYIAKKHADTTLKNHFRENNSVYHCINYNPFDGSIKNYVAGQGLSVNSAWSRGQAWGLYGYTMSYRYTKDERYLRKAQDIAEFILNNDNLPKDFIPYWDFDAPDIPNTLRDASSAAIICSGLLELSTFVNNDMSKRYLAAAEKILSSLSSKTYFSKYRQNGGFILDHSAGNIPGGTEIDVPLTYADYYYVEALCRYKALASNK